MLKSIQGNYKTQYQKNKFILKNQGSIPPNLIQVVDFNQRLNTEYKWNEELYALKKMGNTNTQSTQISKLPFCITETDRMPLENSGQEDSNINIVRPETQIVNKIRIKHDHNYQQKQQNSEQVDLPPKNKIKKFYDSKTLNAMTCNLIESETHIQKTKMIITENQRKKFNQRIIKELQKNHNHESPQTPSSLYQSHPNSPHQQKKIQEGFTQALSSFGKKQIKQNVKIQDEISEEKEEEFKPQLQKVNSQLVSNIFFNPELKLRKSIDMNAILQDKRHSMIYTQTAAFTRVDLWKLNVPADLSFAPRKRTPGKTDSKMVAKKDPPSRKLNTISDDLNIKFPLPLLPTTKIILFGDQKQEPKSKILFKTIKKQMDSNKNKGESISQKFHKMQQQIDTDKMKFLMAEIIQDIKQFLDELLLNDHDIRIYIEEYCLLRVEEFIFLITNFFQFCTSQMVEVVKSAQFSTSNKIRKDVLDTIKKFIYKNLQSKNLKPHIIENFETSWNENCNLFLYPKNNVDNIGGQTRIIKMIKNVTQLLQNDLIVSFPEMTDYNLILAVTSLLNDQIIDFKRYLDLFLLDKNGDKMHVQEYEFFLAKKNIWYVVREAKLESRYKQLIMNKVEYARYYLFPDFDMSSKILRKDLSIELFSKHPIFSSYFIHPDDKSIIGDILDCFYGNLNEDDMVSLMSGKLKHGQFTEQFFEILQEIFQKWIPVYKGIQKKRITLFTQDINYKIYRFRAKSKIGINAFQIVKNNFGNVDNFMEKFSIFFKEWIQDLGNNINNTTVKGNKTCSMDFLQLILRLALDDVSCFNSIDVYYALPHFAVNMTTFTYWAQGMKSFLQEKGINKEDIAHFIQFFIKIVYN